MGLNAVGVGGPSNRFSRGLYPEISQMNRNKTWLFVPITKFSSVIAASNLSNTRGAAGGSLRFSFFDLYPGAAASETVKCTLMGRKLLFRRFDLRRGRMCSSNQIT